MSSDYNTNEYDSELTLSDDSIAQIAKILQVALLTGTDIVDNLRMMRLMCKNNVLSPSKEYTENFEKNIQSLISEASQKTDNED
jgi:hypothetical protein